MKKSYTALTYDKEFVLNIGILLSKNDFMYDIHSLVKSFYPDDEVSIYTADEPEKAGEERDLVFEIEIPDYTDRKEAKDSLKKEVYQMLTDLTGTSLPWGTLSGIRPTKIPMKLLDEAAETTHLSPTALAADQATLQSIHDYMKETYYTSDEKIRLATEVAATERILLSPLDLGNESYSLYVNIPFCPTICLYCTFASSPLDRWSDKIDRYLDALIEEMEHGHRDLMQSGYHKSPTTVYIGGGTPTTLTPQQLDRLLTAIENIWDLTGIHEYTVEAGRPDSFTKEKLAVLKAHGVQRISVNPQTMNQKTLDLIGRYHTVEETKKAFALARSAGFDNINMDMILGLPGETEEDVRHTLSEIEALHPDSLTVHSLAIKRASRLRKNIREDREEDKHANYGNYEGLVFENSNTLMDLSTETARALEMKPYYLYRQKNMRGNLENTGFAQEGKACLYNILIMEEKESIVAFGAGASTKRVWSDGRIDRLVNPKNIDVYEEKLASLIEKKAKLFAEP